MAKTAATPTAVGRVTQVIGSTFDAQFPEDNLPSIYNAVKVVGEQKGIKMNLTGEVQAQLGGGRVRCVALGNTDGMVRGMECRGTGPGDRPWMGGRRIRPNFVVHESGLQETTHHNLGH